MLIKTDPAVIAGYLEDASGFTQGAAGRLVIPENESELAEYLRQASGRGETVTFSGGRTGVAAGCLPLGGTVLSLERLNSLDPVIKTPAGGRITAGPAVRVEAVKAAAAASGLIYGPDPTERNATIGGNVSTNASGGQCYKYGPTRQHVLGLTAVLSTGEKLVLARGEIRADGDRLRLPLVNGRVVEFQRPMLPPLRISKNAAGYFSAPHMDALDLFIGMEGTLAAITSIQLQLLPAPAGVFSLAIFFDQVRQALEIAGSIRGGTGPSPASLEFMDEHSLNLLRPAFPNIPDHARAVLMLEQEYFCAGQESVELARWNSFWEQTRIPEKMIWFAGNREDAQRLRDFRHALPETVNRIVRQRLFPKAGTDLAVPIGEFEGLWNFYQRRLKSSGLEYLIFGHLGECHLHVNVLPRTAAEYQQAREMYLVFAGEAVARDGTVSAEHGIGKLKHDYLKAMVGEAGLREMARIKRILDPALILNRGNIFSENYLSPR